MRNNLYGKNKIKEITKRHNFSFSKSLGQNFLIDYNVIDEILNGANIGNQDLVIEISLLIMA